MPSSSESFAEHTNSSYRPQDDIPPNGFSFDNVHRNAMMERMHKQQQKYAQAGNSNNNTGNSTGNGTSGGFIPMAKKTGTTIVGVLYSGGVVLGADTRATNGEEVAEKNCQKIHYVAPNIYCCGAGTAADTDKTTELISSQLELLRMDTHSPSRVVTACTMLKRMLYRYQGHIGAHLILGGTDLNGPHLYMIHAHGSTSKLPYCTMGSGSLAAMAVMESSWKAGLDEPSAVALVKRAITAGIFNDLGSGSNCDVCTIRLDGTVHYDRGAVQPNPVKPLRDSIRRSDRFHMRPGTTEVLQTDFVPHPTATAGAATLADVTVTEMEVES